MKTKLYCSSILLTAALWLSNALAQEISSTNNAPCKVGVYDSRAVAFAFFWSEEQQKERGSKIAAVQEAKRSGNTNRLNILQAELEADQAQQHRQVFSTAPVENALATIKGKLPEILRAAGATNLISKWNVDALKQHGTCEKVDITDRLVRAFIQPTEQQQKTIRELQKQKPLPLEKCDELIRKGEI